MQKKRKKSGWNNERTHYLVPLIMDIRQMMKSTMNPLSRSQRDLCEPAENSVGTI